MSCCAVIPVYNHPGVLSGLVAELQAHQLAVLLIDDGSNHDCATRMDALAALHPQVHVYHHPHNCGKGAAVMTGLLQAQQLGYSHALQLDADGQHDWADIGRFLRLANENPLTMIIGKPVYDDSVPKLRYYARYATHIWIWINTLSLQIQDSMCGFRVYPLALVNPLIKRHRINPRMGFDSEVLVRLAWQNTKFINVTTRVTYPRDGVSHFRLRDNLGLATVHTRLFFGMLWRLPKLLCQRKGIHV